MKRFSEVAYTRLTYHRAPERDSVNRAAATFPIRDSGRHRNNVTFLNHWKIKRGVPWLLRSTAYVEKPM